MLGVALIGLCCSSFILSTTGLKECTSSQWECKSGDCIPANLRCDGGSDCDDKSDEENCGPPKCTLLQWMCKSGKCIPNRWRCDGDRDCKDGSDEEYCGQSTCKSSEWMCKSGQCIPKRWKCNGDNNCNDRSDEENCGPPTCKPSEWMCKSGQCIPKGFKCDKGRDCYDGSDEENCAKEQCMASQWLCKSGGCIPKRLKCDGDKDCKDGSDEEDCESKCKETEFMCNNSMCIPSKLRCNGVVDCIDKSDESSCEPESSGDSKCPPTHWVCSDNECILDTKMCDGKMDCSDGSDEEDCGKDVNHTLIYCARKSIRVVNTNGSIYQLRTPQLKAAVALDLDVKQNHVYWSDISDERLYRASIDAEKEDTVILLRNVGQAQGLTVDWIGRKLYWTDAAAKRIDVAELDGKINGTLVDLDQNSNPRAIACHPSEGYLYWTDWGNEAAIERISMDGNKTTREAIIKQDIRWPNGLTLDFEYNRLYWADAKLWRLEAANLDGTGRRILVRNIIGFPFSLTNVGKWLYWSDWLDSTIKATTKFRSTKNMKTVGIPSPRIMGVKAVDASGQPSGENPCGTNNGFCSHFCLIAAKQSGRSFSCRCPRGMHLKSDGRTCGDKLSSSLAE